MLRYRIWRPLTTLSLGVVFSLMAICFAAGQEVDSWAGPEWAPADELRLAQQPEGAPPADSAAEPPGGPPADAGRPPVGPGAGPPAPRPPQPPRRPPTPPDLRSMLAARSPLVRLASMPNMFGDSMGLTTQIIDNGEIFLPPDGPQGELFSVLDVPPAGASGHVKIGENNKAMPIDRVYFTYNHFANALETSAVGPFGPRTFSLDRYTLGVEKTFRDGQCSTELRMPFGGGYHLDTPGFGVEGAEVGNLAIIFKTLLYATRSMAVAGGLGIDTPTGGDVTGQTFFSDYVLYNDAVHLSPWVGFLRAPNDRIFYQGFLQVDVATNPNRVDFGGNRIGSLSDQTLMIIDLETGYWVYRNPSARCLNGLASILELHYTSTLQDADVVSGTDGFQFLTFSNTFNRLDVLNLTVGLHAEFGLTTLAVGGVFPLSTNTNRTFDAELQVFLDRHF